MSVAFAREDSAEAASETVLPVRPISDRINLVTERASRCCRMNWPAPSSLSEPPTRWKMSTRGDASQRSRLETCAITPNASHRLAHARTHVQ